MQQPVSGHDFAFEQLLGWLVNSGLTQPGPELGATPHPPSQVPRQGFLDETYVLGQPCQRAERARRERIKALKAAYEHSSPGVLGDKRRWQSIYQEIRNPEEAVRRLDVRRIPADAIAFYRPFHITPVDSWGIYIMIPRMLDYLDGLASSLGSLNALPPQVLATMVLFDVFHHEFFHHLVECTATTLEVLGASTESVPAPVYLEYQEEEWAAHVARGQSEPIEEALANAYAYNSFSFAARVRSGYLDGASRLYQKAMVKAWHFEPPGYRDAAKFIKGGQLEGARVVVERMLSRRRPCADVPLDMLVRSVFPKGHTAFWQKADIPTFLVGAKEEIAAFLKLVPEPNEAYATLFWPGESDPLDDFIKSEKAKEKVQKQAAKAKS